MNAQEIFNAVVIHLNSMNCMSKDKDGCNRYCGPHDMKTPVGLLIPDELYTPKMETYTFGVSFCRQFSLPEWMVTNCKLIQTLQRIHNHPINWIHNKIFMWPVLTVIAKLNNIDLMDENIKHLPWLDNESLIDYILYTNERLYLEL